MTKHEKKELRKILWQWRQNIRAGKSMSKFASARKMATAMMVADTLCDITARHAAQVARILRRAR